MQRATKLVVQTRSEGPLLEPWERDCVLLWRERPTLLTNCGLAVKTPWI